MRFFFQNHTISPEEIQKLTDLDSSYLPVVNFVQNWMAGNESFEFYTSGSTGTPKQISIQKSQITASVIATANYLKLLPNEKVLLCLNPGYIAALMMVARALLLDMDVHIIKPTSNPISAIQDTQIDFASFVPLQIYQTINSGKLAALANIKNILIGGAPLSHDAFNQLAQLKNNIFVTYGMTETVSHIALMPVKGDAVSSYYNVLSNVTIGVTHENCLWIKGNVTLNNKIESNDVVELLSTNDFRWLGRKDNIINSGGIKIHPESLEKAVEDQLMRFGISNAYYIGKVNDSILGERLVLFVENDGNNHLNEEKIIKSIKPIIENQFSKYHLPKEVRFVNQFDRTESEKIKRS